MKIVLNGAMGRMGRLVIEAAGRVHDDVVALFERPDHPDIGREIETPFGRRKLAAGFDLANVAADVAIDFSCPDAAVAFASAVTGRGIPVLCGTTGLSEAQMTSLRSFSKRAAVLCTPNTSIGIYCLHELSALARAILGPDYDVEIMEVHHRHKRDAPSGTALSLAERLSGIVKTGREGQCGPREASEIGVMAIRGGEVVGDHTVFFLGPYDRLELTHRVMSRQVFAEGALALARRLAKKQAGWYRLQDLLLDHSRA